MVIAGYIIANRPIGTPRLIAFGTVSSNVPPAIALIASIGGVSAKSEIASAFPTAMPTAMLTSTKNGSRRKSSSRVSRDRMMCKHPRRGHVSRWPEVTKPRDLGAPPQGEPDSSRRVQARR